MPSGHRRKLTGAERIMEERRRQIMDEGWSAEHDAQHKNGELAVAAACYAVEGLRRQEETKNGNESYCIEVTYDASGGTYDQAHPDAWPWDHKWDKRGKHSRIHQLEIAGALIAAEIDRLLASEDETK